MGVASLVLGIIAIALGWTGVGIIPGILSIIFGILALTKKKDKKGLVGIILSVVGIGCAAFIFGRGFVKGMRAAQESSGTITVAEKEKDTGSDEEEIPFSWDDWYGDSGSEEEEEQGVKKNKDGKKFYVGDVIEGSNWILTYVSKGDFPPDNQFYEPKPNTKLVYVEVEVENISGRDQIVAATSFDAYADGYECDWYCSKEDLSATLSDGRKATGKAVFEVPKDAKEIEFEFNDNLWKSEKIILVFKE